MKTKRSFLVTRFLNCLVLISLFSSVPDNAMAQANQSRDITVYQYRQVAPEKVDEFIKRETTYWSEVARKATEKGNLQFWALLQKMGGYDLQNSSNFLFINTYKNIDDAGSVWSSATTVFPKVPIAQMETTAMSKVTSTLFLSVQAWEQAAKAVPDKDFKYVMMIYHNASDAGALIALEKKHWAPFIKEAMDKGQTTQMGWGNAVLLSPYGDDLNFNTVSYDLYPSLQQALYPKWDEKTVFPQEGLTEINKLEKSGRSADVYRIVKVVAAPNPAVAGN